MPRFTQNSIRTGWGKNARRYRRISYRFSARSLLDAARHSAKEEAMVILRLRQRTGQELTSKNLKTLEGLVFVPELV
jgi:hypothetical protein